jgi:hypothetical protein
MPSNAPIAMLARQALIFNIPTKMKLNSILLHGQVWFQGYAFAGQDRKVLWPAAIITVSLYSTDDAYYASRRVQLDTEHHFRHALNNVSHADRNNCDDPLVLNFKFFTL